MSGRLLGTNMFIGDFKNSIKSYHVSDPNRKNMPARFSPGFGRSSNPSLAGDSRPWRAWVGGGGGGRGRGGREGGLRQGWVG